MLSSLSYSIGHGLFREEIHLTPQEVQLKRFLFSHTVKEIKLSWPEILSFRVLPHDQFRPLGKGSESPDHLLFIFYRHKGRVKRLGIYLSLGTVQGKEVLEFLEQALGPKKALAPKVTPFRYFILGLIFLWILELALLPGVSMLPLLVLLWLTYFFLQKAYVGW